MQAAKALVGLHIWPGSSEPSLLDNALSQGCGNTMPDLSDMVPFHPGQVEKGYFHLCPRMDFLQTLHINNSLNMNYENVFIELDS